MARRVAIPTLSPITTGVVVGTALALWTVADVVGPELVPGNDGTGHLVRAEVGIDILRSGRLDGWNPRFGVGYEQFLFYGPGFTWALGLLRLLTLGALSDAGALKVLAVASFAAVPGAAAFCSRSLGLGARAAGLAAVTSLLASGPFGVGLEGTFGLGLFPQQLAGVLVLVAVGAIVRTLRSGATRWAVLTGVVAFALVVTHLISVMIVASLLLVIIPAVVLHERGALQEVPRLLAVAGTVAGAAAFWLLPLAVHRNLHGPVAGWATPPFGMRIGDIVQGRALFLPVDVAFVLAGLAWGFVRVGRGRPYAVVVAAGPIAVLALQHWSLHGLPNEFTFQLANRSLGLLGILATFPLAAGLAELSRRRPVASRTGLIAAFALVGFLVVRGSTHRGLLDHPPDPLPEARAAADELRRVVPDGARFATVRNPPVEPSATGVLQPDRWLAWASGRNTLNVYPVELSSAPAASSPADTLHETAPEVAADGLRHGGVSHVVTVAPDDLARYAAAEDDFEVVWRGGSLAILEVLGEDDQPPPSALFTAAAPADGALLAFERERVVLEVDAAAPTTISVAVAWSPKWHATVAGVAVEPRRAADGLVELDVPAGPTTVELRFRPDRWNAVGAAGSVVTLAGLLAVAVGGRRRRRTPDDPPAAPDDAGQAAGNADERASTIRST